METQPVVEAWRNSATLMALAETHYRTDLPYHTWAHALDVRTQAMKKARLCIEHGATVDTVIVEAASLWHDANYWYKPYTQPKVPYDHRYSSRERYSAFIAKKDLLTLGMPSRRVNHIGRSIYSTEYGVACSSLEARCVRQADLANVASKFPLTFLNATYRLYAESKKLEGEKVGNLLKSPDAFFKDFLGFTAISYEILRTYNEEDVSLGDFDRDEKGRCLFSIECDKNIELLVPSRLSRILDKYASNIIDYRQISL